MSVWNDDGIKQDLDDLTNNTTLVLRLAQNDPNGGVWDNTLTHASFTESTFAGYAAVNMVFGGLSTVTAHIAANTANAISFTSTGAAQNVNGWYITDVANTKLYACGRDSAAPVSISSTGTNVYTVTVTLKAKDVAT